MTQQTIWPTRQSPPENDALSHRRDTATLAVSKVCCNAPDLGDSYHGGRPFQCLHAWEAWRRGK